MKVWISVTHLLGTGHLSRALTLGRAFAAAGHQVRLASGGMAAPQLDVAGVDLLQLPPLRSDGTNFTHLLSADGTPVTDQALQQRSAQQVQALRAFQPDIVITELFPFGRRVLADEFLALLNAARALPRMPVVLASVRDILAPPSKPSKATRADQIIAQFYDAVLVHADDRATTLDRSWPVSDMLRARLRYTGYVAPPAAPPHADGLGQGEVLVTAGGGSVGTPLFQAACQAAALRPDLTWRLLVGGSDASARMDHLSRLNSPALLEPARPDFRSMLPHARASISMCGYNTAMDLLQAGTPAVLIPFDDGREVEQSLRADSLAQLPGVRVLPSARLTPQRLIQALDAVQADPPRDVALNFDGAARSVAIATDLAQGRP